MDRVGDSPGEAGQQQSARKCLHSGYCGLKGLNVIWGLHKGGADCVESHPWAPGVEIIHSV